MSRHPQSRTYWKVYPKEQGIASFCIAIASIVFASIINLVVSDAFFNEAYILLISVFLYWGISCLIVGLVMDKKKEK